MMLERPGATRPPTKLPRIGRRFAPARHLDRAAPARREYGEQRGHNTRTRETQAILLEPLF
jgi:hypothetical protein